MEINRPNIQQATAQELQKLEKLQAIIESAIADGKITLNEYEKIKTEIYTQGKSSAEQFYRELELYRSLVQEKLEKGELEYESPEM